MPRNSSRNDPLRGPFGEALQLREYPMAVATLYRMVLPEHTCLYGVAAKERLEAAGLDVNDRVLRSREEVESFKAKNDVETTPLILIDGEPVGGMVQLEQYLAGRQLDEAR